MELYWHDSLEWLYPDQLKENALKTKTPVLDVPRGGIASIVLVVDQVSAETEISIAADTPGCQLFEMVDVCVNNKYCRRLLRCHERQNRLKICRPPCSIPCL